MASRLALVRQLVEAFKSALGNTPPGETQDLKLYFCICRMCRRVTPMWRYLNLKHGDPRGCVCGHGDFSPANISSWRGMWWFVVRGWFVRGFLMGRTNWDPRLREYTTPVML